MDGSSWFEDYCEKLRIKKAVYANMSTNDIYANWLAEYLIKNNELSDDDNLQNIGDDIDIENAKNLNLFFEVIADYADKNYITPINTEFGCYYKVLIKGLGFEIGCMSGQGTLFYANTTPVSDIKEFINFDDILNRKVQDNVPSINKKLNEINSLIFEVSNEGVPVWAIEKSVNSAIEDIKFQEKSKKLELKK